MVSQSDLNDKGLPINLAHVEGPEQLPGSEDYSPASCILPPSRAVQVHWFPWTWTACSHELRRLHKPRDDTRQEWRAIPVAESCFYAWVYEIGELTKWQSLFYHLKHKAVSSQECNLRQKCNAPVTQAGEKPLYLLYSSKNQLMTCEVTMQEGQDHMKP